MRMIRENPKDVIPNISERNIYNSLIVLTLKYHIAILTKQITENGVWLNWFGIDRRVEEYGEPWGYETNGSLINLMIKCWNRWERNEYNIGNIKIYVCENTTDVDQVIKILSSKLPDRFRETILANAWEIFK